MPCGSICPASDALCIAGFKQASACQPPTREICCIGPGIVEELYNAGYNVYIIYLNIFMYILKAYIKTTRCWHPLPLSAWSAPREVNPTFRTTPPGLQFLRKLGPNFQNTGLEIEPRFPAKPLRRKSVPNLGRSWGESSLQPKEACAPPTRPNSGGQHGHTSSFATWPSTKSKIQNPNSKRPVWILDFGFRILDFGFRILDFGFWISDFGFWISLVFVLFAAAPDFGFRILDFGFRILDFGFWARIRIRRHRLDPA